MGDQLSNVLRRYFTFFIQVLEIWCDSHTYNTSHFRLAIFHMFKGYRWLMATMLVSPALKGYFRPTEPTIHAILVRSLRKQMSCQIKATKSNEKNKTKEC